MMQLQLALHGQGLLDDVETAIAAGDLPTKIYWAKAPTVHRDHPLTAAIATALGKSDAEVDDMFRTAVAIT